VISGREAAERNRIVERWIHEQNLERFKRFLALETNAASRRTLQSMIAQAERELALLNAAASGAGGGPRPASGHRPQDANLISQVQRDLETSSQLYLLLDPGPGLHIVEANAAYAAATMTDPLAVAGQRMFDVFPDNPDDPLADGVSLLLRSLQIAAATGLRHRMKIQRYDVRNAEGIFVERFWRPRNIPLLNEEGRLLYLLHHVEDVTQEVLAERSLDPATTAGTA
jgi:PAS domain-containing protein